MHKYIDLFVQSMKEIGDKEEGIELRKVSLKQYLSLTICNMTIVLIFCSGQTGSQWT